MNSRNVKKIPTFIRIDEGISRKIEQEATTNNMSKAETIEMICREYFNFESIKKGDETLKQIVKKLAQQNESLNNNLMDLTIMIREVLDQIEK
ncbi:hypothetical protein AB9M75_06180 [Lactobacillus sp. AN1001]